MSIFEDKTEKMPVEGRDPPTTFAVSPGADYPKGDAPVRVTMTPAEERALRMSNYPRYDAMDVEHVTRSRRGHGY